MTWDLSMHKAWTIGWLRDAEQSRQARLVRDAKAEAEAEAEAATPPRREKEVRDPQPAEPAS